MLARLPHVPACSQAMSRGSYYLMLQTLSPDASALKHVERPTTTRADRGWPRPAEFLASCLKAAAARTWPSRRSPRSTLVGPPERDRAEVTDDTPLPDDTTRLDDYPLPDDTTWLTDEQQRAWRQLAAVLLKLPIELDRQLQRDAEMTHFEYWVLAMLSEAPDHRLQLKDLSARINSSASRLSHVMRRLEQRGWVHRVPNPHDGRANDAILTDSGLRKVVASAPGHVAAVSDLVFASLTTTDVHDLLRICERIAERLDRPPQATS